MKPFSLPLYCLIPLLLLGAPAFSATVTDMTPELEGLICTLLDGGDNLVSGDTMTADVVGPGGVLDGIDDVTITYTEYTSGGATAAATCDGAGAVSVGASSSGANAGDFAFFNICIEFLPGAVVSAANLADFSLSSANGASVEYEFGLIEVTPRGMPKTVTSAALGAYNVNDYPGNGGANTLLHDLFTPAQQEGIGFFTDEAVDITLGPCGVGATCGAGNCEYTSSTGIPSGGQHYVANAVGGAINNFYTTAAAQAAVTDVGAISFWYGIFDVNDCSSSSPGGSMTADEQTVCVPPPPCTIEAVTVSDPMCLGNDASFDVSFNVTNGGGTYNVVAATADAVNGITAGQILATGAASPITVTLTGPTAAGSFDVNVEDTTAFDAAGNICSGTAVTVSIPVCEIPPNPCISLSKEADLVGALAGDTVTYTLIATNCGEALLTNVILTDALLGATLSAPTSIAGDANVANGMDTNEAWQWTATYVVMQADVDSGMQLVNTAGVTADSSAGPVDDMAEAVVCVSPSCTKSTGACFIEIDFDEPAFADVLGAPITEGGEGAVAGEEVQSPTGDPFNWTYGFNVIEDGTCNEWDAATYAGRPATDADDIFITYTAINQTPHLSQADQQPRRRGSRRLHPTRQPLRRPSDGDLRAAHPSRGGRPEEPSQPHQLPPVEFVHQHRLLGTRHRQLCRRRGPSVQPGLPVHRVQSAGCSRSDHRHLDGDPGIHHSGPDRHLVYRQLRAQHRDAMRRPQPPAGRERRFGQQRRPQRHDLRLRRSRNAERRSLRSGQRQRRHGRERGRLGDLVHGRAGSFRTLQRSGKPERGAGRQRQLLRLRNPEQRRHHQLPVVLLCGQPDSPRKSNRSNARPPTAPSISTTPCASATKATAPTSTGFKLLKTSCNTFPPGKSTRSARRCSPCRRPPAP